MRKICAVTLLLLVFGLSFASLASAEGAYRGYIYDSRGMAVPSVNGYRYEFSIDGNFLETGPFKTIEDLFIDRNGKLYIVDSGNNRIVRMNLDQTDIEVFGDTDGPGKLNTPKGIYVDDNGDMYVADTENQRIVVLNVEGIYLREYGQPDSPLIGRGFTFKPSKIAIDMRNYMLVISEGSVDGLMQIDMNGEFRGYFGANRVPFSFRDAITRLIATKEQRAQFANVKPPEFSNLVVDDSGFIYTTTKGVHVAQVKRLSPVGVNTLEVKRYGDLRTPWIAFGELMESFVDVTVNDQGVITALDEVTGRAFQYDKMGNLMFIFGGLGDQDGLFLTPSSIVEAPDGTIYISDKTRDRIDVFRTTPFGDLVHKASEMYVNGEYQNAIEPWTEVIKINSNYDMAYRAIGKAKMRTDEFREAMRYFRLANQRGDYSEAYYEYRKQFVREHFVYFFFGTIVFFVALSYLRGFLRKRKFLKAMYAEVAATAAAPPSYWREFFGNVRQVLRHPIEFYTDLRDPGRTKVSHAFIILASVIVVHILSLAARPFLFRFHDYTSVSYLLESLMILVPWVTWAIVNTGLATVLDGEGKFTEVLVGSAYALVPYVVFSLPITFLSYIITYRELDFYNGMWSLVYAWIALLLVLKVKLVHDFTLFKVFWIGVMTLFGMLVFWLICFLLFGLANQFVTFILDLYREVSFRGGL
jgi:tetratricopeptide (TPR) repeat protein